MDGDVGVFRGGVVDDAALAHALDTRDLRAGLDVYEDEPAASAQDFPNPLARHPKVVATHHVGASTMQAQAAVADEVLQVIDAFAAALPPGEPVLAGVESAGIPHSSALAYSAGLPSVFVRKAAKEHGLGRRIEGGDVAGQRTILVEDMVTTGGSSLSAVEALREAGAAVSDCFAIITYGFSEALEAFDAAGVTLTTLTTFEAVVAEALTAGTVDEREAELVRSWLSDPHAWDDR